MRAPIGRRVDCPTLQHKPEAPSATVPVCNVRQRSAYSKRRVPRDKAMLLRTTTLLGLVGLVVAAATDITVDPTHARALLVRSRSPSL